MDDAPESRGLPGAAKAGIALAVLVVIALVMLFAFKGRQAERVAAPTGYTAYKAKDNSFVCELPAGWKQKGGAAGSITSGVTAVKGGASIDITYDLAGSLRGDMEKSRLTMMGSSRSPVYGIHQELEEELKSRWEGLTARPPKRFQSKMGDACYSEFVAQGGNWGGRIRGYAVTMLGGERRVKLICYCPEQDWPNLRSSFVHVANTLAAGSG